MNLKRDVRRLAILLAVFLVAVFAGCDREQARNREEQARERERENLHAQRLEQEMTKLQAEISAWKSPEPRGGKEYDRVIPEWKTYNEALERCRQLLDQALGKMAAKQFSEIPPLAAEGIRTAQKLDLMILESSPGVEQRAKAAGAIFPEFFSAYYTYLRAASLLYQGRFLQPLSVLSLHAPRAERQLVVEQIASLYSEAKAPGESGLLAQALQKAWAEEDHPANKAQIEQKLKQLGLPLTPPAASPAPDVKSKL
ncbi:MAG: hypothetical protein ACREBD_16845 [Blastocatellia bacterium]